MRNKHKFVAAIAMGVLAGTGVLSAEAICGPARSLRPVRCLCGMMTDQTGGPAANVVVRVMQNGEQIATTTTSSDGEFKFGELPAGKYELTADGFRPVRSPVVIARPTERCSHRMRITLVVPYPDNCGSFVTKQ